MPLPDATRPGFGRDSLYRLLSCELRARPVLQSSRSCCSKRPRCRRRVVLLGDWLPVQRPSSRRCIARIWVPRSRFAVGPRPGCAVFHRQIGPLAVKQAATDSRRASASLWSFAQQLPVRPPQRTDASHGLLFPSARADLGDRFFVPGDSQSPRASAFRVCLPS
jgi:hypothetical protein